MDYKFGIVCAAITLFICAIELILTIFYGKIPSVEDHCIWIGVTSIWALCYSCLLFEFRNYN